MLRRVGSASAPNVWSSDTYLGTWLTIRNDVEPVNAPWRMSAERSRTWWERLYMHAAVRFCANGCEHRGRVA
jgi:hypothetical protein